jgi:O-antigen/teichoic acid export membrane protein
MILKKNPISPLFQPGKTLQQRIVRSGLWNLGLRICIRTLTLIQTFILARLLLPEDFGLFGLAILVLHGLEMFSQTGFETALIQKQGDTRSYLDTAWCIQVIRALITTIVLLALSQPAAIFFEEPNLKTLLQALAFGQLIGGFINIGTVYFQKELDFSKVFLLQFTVAVSSLLIGIIAAYCLRNAWALIITSLFGIALQVFLSYMVHPFRPRLKFEGAKARELFQFGGWMTVATILKFFLMKGDDIVVGKILGSTPLAFYQMAYRISQSPSTEVGTVISQIVFPAYSIIQTDRNRLKRTWLQTLQMTTLITLPLAAGILISASPFVAVVLGERWVAIVPATKVLCVLGAVKSVEYASLFKAVGRPQLIVKISAVRLGILVMLIYPLTVKFNIVGAGLAVLIATLAVNPWWLLAALRLTGARLRDFIGAVWAPAAGTVIMSGTLLLYVGVFKPQAWLSLIFLVAIGLVSYCGSVVLLDYLTGGKLLAVVKVYVRQAHGA